MNNIPGIGDKIHELKCWPEFFLPITTGRKTFELRSTLDRTFEAGEFLWLREYLPSMQKYTGDNLYKKITYILQGPAFGLQEGYAILAFN